MKNKTLRLLLAGSSALLFIASCKKDIMWSDPQPQDHPTVNSNNGQGQEKKVYVANLDELYAAVNDPGNAGAEVNLAAGIYVLNSSYPNGGRLELQRDMSLRGQPGQIDAVLIDQSLLPFASHRLSPSVSTSPIRIGRGTNSLEWLSVKGGSVAANPLSVIESDLLGAETNVTLSHVYVDCNGSRTGVLLRNRLSEHANRVINATLEFSEIANAFSNPGTPGAGLALQNRISGAQINLNMNGNYIHNCRIGILNFNSGLGNNVDNCSLNITSHNDRIEGNGCGLDLTGGSGAPVAYANNNTVTVKIYGATIKDNGLPQLAPNNGALLSGIYAAGAWGAIASGNVLEMRLWGCDISNNNALDIYAYGAFSPNAVIAGTNNRFDLYLYGISANAIVSATACVPAEPAGTNVVNVFRN